MRLTRILAMAAMIPVLAVLAAGTVCLAAPGGAHTVPFAEEYAASVRPAGTYERLCYTPLSRLKTLRASSGRTYSYDALTLQEALVYLDFPPPVPIKMDGWYGPATASAVKAYQRSRHLYVDGVVGRQTWRQLRSELC